MRCVVLELRDRLDLRRGGHLERERRCRDKRIVLRANGQTHCARQALFSLPGRTPAAVKPCVGEGETEGTMQQGYRVFEGADRAGGEDRMRALYFDAITRFDLADANGLESRPRVGTDRLAHKSKRIGFAKKKRGALRV